MRFPRRLIVGLGSPHGDDAAGWHIVDEIARIAPSERAHRVAHPAVLLDLIGEVDELIVCDACRGGDPPGTVRAWPWPLPAEFVHQNPRNSHDLGLIEVLNLAEKLGQLPARINVWTIQADEHAGIDVISNAVRRAIPGAGARIVASAQGAI